MLKKRTNGSVRYCQYTSNAIEQGLRAEHGVVTEDDILMELTKWVEASDNDILSDIYQQTINYVVSGQHPTL
ncbi:biofilm-dependent modulation protein [Escherichia coli]|nr:biofilm-dependent modulation protein [Escherichia coli]